MALTGVAGIALASFAGCDSEDPFFRRTFSFTFETGLAGWAPDGTDLDDPPVEWSIEASDERADDGQNSVRLHLENLNDAGKIWIERSFELAPRTTYEVRLSYDFATADFGDVNLWRVIAGAANEDPETVDDLEFQGDTGNGAGEDVGFVWLRKEFTFTATTGSDGRLWVFLGVWGTSEFGRTYFVDGVDLAFTPR